MSDLYFRPFSDYTGGDENDLDGYDGETLQEGEAALVVKSSTGIASIHYLDSDSGETEDSPDIVEPDNNAENKRWKRAKVMTDASVVDFLQSGTGAVQRTIEDKERDIISVKDFEAVGDGDGAGGGTDDSEAIIAALTYIQTIGGNAKLTFPAGIYLCDSVLGSYSFSNVVIDFCGATLDFSNVATDVAASVLTIAGSYTAAPVALTGNAAAAQKTIACVSTTFAAGDFVRVYSETKWDDSNTDTLIGELNFIETVPDDASVTVTADLQSGYTTAATGSIQKLTPVKDVIIKDGRIIGPGANDLLTGIDIQLGINCIVTNIHSYDIDVRHVLLQDCIFCKVYGCHFEQSNAATTGYGVSFSDASQDCQAIGNSFVDVRHSLSTNTRPASSHGVVRRILFEGNIVSDSAKATGGTGGDAIDSHGGSDQTSIINNFVHASSASGINFEGCSCIIKGNHIRNCQGAGILYINRTDQTGYAIISDNMMWDLNLDAERSQYGLYVSTMYANCSDLIISNNRVIAKSTVLILNWTDPYTFEKVSITGNVLRHSSAPSSNAAFDAEYVISGAISNNVIESNTVGMSLDHCDHVSVLGNSILIVGQGEAATAYGIYVSNSSYCPILGNTMEDDTNATTTVGVQFANSTTYSGIWNNITEGFDANLAKGTGTGNVDANNI